MTDVVPEGAKLLILDPNQAYAIETDHEQLTSSEAQLLKERFRSATGCHNVVILGKNFRIARERQVDVSPSLTAAARTIVEGIAATFGVDMDRTDVHDRDRLWMTDTQAMCLAEEAGEFLGAYRRWVGRARRRGDFDDVKAELADVVIAAHVMAVALNVDLDELVADKLETVLTRGWRQPEPDPEPVDSLALPSCFTCASLGHACAVHA